MDVETEPPSPESDLIRALEEATAMAKQLHVTTDQSQFLQIQNSIQLAQHHLSLFLENSHSETNAAAGAEPMEMEDEEHDSKDADMSVSKVEERMRECFIMNKRPKRQRSPSSAVVAEQRRVFEDHDGGGVVAELDYVGSKLRALDLIYQFHA